MKTASSILLDHLKTLNPGETFTASLLNSYYPDMSNGAISGFINRMKTIGAIRVVKVTSGSNRVAETFEVTPDFDLASVYVKETYNGRKQGHANHVGTTDRKRLSELLLSIAGEVENMKGSLADYSTEELLKEVSRRVKDKS